MVLIPMMIEIAYNDTSCSGGFLAIVYRNTVCIILDCVFWLAVGSVCLFTDGTLIKYH